MRIRYLVPLMMGLVVATGLTQPVSVPADVALEQARKIEVFDGDLPAAIEQYRQIAERYRLTDRASAAEALVRMARVQARLGRPESSQTFGAVVRMYPEQAAAVAEASRRLAAQAGGASVASSPDTEAVQLYAGRDYEGDSAISADGRYLVYSSWTEKTNLFVRALTTGTVRPLTRDAGGLPGLDPQPYSPVFSPDGRRVAYLRIGRPTSIRVVDRDGSNTQVLLEGAGDLVYDWSRDGRWIALNLYDAGQSRLALLPVDGGSPNQLVSTGWRKAHAARFSPDGRFLVYSVPATPREPDAEAGVFVVATDGGRHTKVADGGAYPAWTPDGRGVVYLSDEAGSGGLWTIAMAGGQPTGTPRRLAADMAGARNLRFTDAGDLYYEVRARGADVLLATFDSARRRLNEPAKLTADADAVMGGAAWSADGRQVAFIRDGALVVRTVVTGEEHTVPTTVTNALPVINFGLRWFADGGSVLLREQDSGGAALTRVDVRTGTRRVVVDGATGSSLRQFDLSPDGRVLYYVHREPLGDLGGAIFRLVARQVTTGQEKDVYSVREPRATAAVGGLVVSPDATRLALRDVSGNRLLVIPADGGTPVEVQRGAGAIEPAAWTRDGRFIIGTRSTDTASQLWAVPVAGGELIDLNLSAAQIRRVSVSPADGRLLLSVLQPSHEIRLIRNLPAAGARRQIWKLEHVVP